MRSVGQNEMKFELQIIKMISLTFLEKKINIQVLPIEDTVIHKGRLFRLINDIK